ncbi:MAG: hypothetical protein JWM96_264, partial [Alphaproteobacteria bacterium]|nr:hypothetical protein [Alphaproteobacteria bacterium]
VLSNQLGNVPKIMSMGAYVIGTFFIIKSLFKMKGFVDAPDDNPLSGVLAFAIVGVLLITLPYLIGVVTKTVGAQNSNVTSSSTSFTDTGF